MNLRESKLRYEKYWREKGKGEMKQLYFNFKTQIIKGKIISHKQMTLNIKKLVNFYA